MLPEAARIQCVGQSAQSLGREFHLKIKSLHDCESTMTGVSGRGPNAGAVVEFRTRASAGAAT
jgi:hypothetical protein